MNLRNDGRKKWRGRLTKKSRAKQREAEKMKERDK